MVGRFLLPGQAGVVATSINLALLLSSISFLGFQGALSKLIPEYLEKRQHSKIVSLTRFSLKIIVLSNVTIVSILFLLFPAVSTLIKLPTDALILSITILFSVTISSFFGSIVYGFQEMKRFFKTDFVGVLAKVLLTLILLLSGFGYLGPLTGVLVGYILIDLMRFRKSWFFSPDDKINGKKIFFSYSFPAFIASITGLVFSNFQVVLLAALESQEATGIYALTFLITSVALIIPSVLSQALFPITSLLSVGRRIKKQSYFIQLVFRYAAFLILPVAIFLVFFSRPIILLLRPEYMGATVLFPTLTLAAIFFGLSQVFLSNIYALGKTKLHRNIWIFLSIVFLVLAPILIKLYSAQGLALSYLISSALALFMGYHFIKKILNLKIRWTNLLKVVISSIIFSFFLLLADLLEVSLIIKILVALSGSIIYLAVLIPLRFYIQEDVRVLEFIAIKIPFLKKQISGLAKFLSKRLEPKQN
jgi:O-antigen/teichoic acid export membrane protein